MSGILRLESLTKGNTLKQGDKTPLKYRLFDADGEKLNIAGKSAKVRLVYPDFLTIGYEKDGLTVAQDDTVTFTIDNVIPARIYHVEIIVDGTFIFPSRADEAKFTVDKSSLGTETNIIEIVGKDILIREVKSQVDTELQPLVTSLESAQQAEAQRVLAEQKRVQGYQEIQQIIEDGVLNAVPADGSVTTEKLANASVTTEKLDDAFGSRGDLSAGTDLKTLINQGVYFGQPNGGYLNTPVGFATNRYFELRVDVLSQSWAIQKFVDFTNPSNVWHKTIHRTNFSVNNAWEYVGTPANASVNRVKLSDNFSSSGVLASGTNLDKIVKEGVYLGISTYDYDNLPSGTTDQSFVLKVQVGGAVNSFITQELIIIGDSSKFYKRLNTNADNPGTWSEFKVSSSGGTGGGTGGHLAGKTIVQFGDSIYGNKRPPNDISTALANKTGATVFNLGMGGSRMSQHQQFWDATSMYRLADSIATGDYSLQDGLIAEYDAGRLSSLPYYIKGVIQLMKTIDWNNVDIITIAHGTNDLTANVLSDADADEFDTTTYAGALRYSLRAILEKYPHINVFVISPMYRFWTQDNAPYDFIEDSDEAVFSGGKLPDFVKKAEEVSAEFKTHYIDAYSHFGIGKSNRHYYFNDLTGHGGTHHNDAGAEYIGKKLGSIFLSMF